MTMIFTSLLFIFRRFRLTGFYVRDKNAFETSFLDVPWKYKKVNLSAFILSPSACK